MVTADGFLTGLTCLSVNRPHARGDMRETRQTRQARQVARELVVPFNG